MMIVPRTSRSRRPAAQRTRQDAPDDAGKAGSTANAMVASMLREAANLLEAQGANPFRAAAYRKAADTVAGLRESVRELFTRAGRGGLETLPAIGAGSAAAIVEILLTGRWGQLDRLRGAVNASQVFQSVPGIGAELGRRIHEALGIDTLEALEAAAHDGRLEGVPGVGPRRASAIRAMLTQMLDRARALRRARVQPAAGPEPTVEEMLDVDREYRAKGLAGALPTIAPRRFNPAGKAWLPVLHAQRGPWQFTALFSNTARAHELERERDWVVIYFYDGDHVERQRTVVTEARGPMAGRRVVRGREAECRSLYERATAPEPQGRA